MAIERVVFRAWGDRFVRPGGDSGDGALEAISPGIGPWEVFRLEWPSEDTVRIRAHNGGLVHEAPSVGGDSRLWPSGAADDPRTLFGLIWHGDDRVTLKAHNGQYVCAEPDGKLQANRGAIGEWEKFLLEEPPPL
jgi:hypothetical protein